MASEARLNIGLQISKGNLQFRSNPTAFTANVSGTKGPVPGAITVAVTGTNVNFSELTTPGLCRITNLDSTNFVTYGVYDGASFFPLGEILPGEFYLLRLSRYLNEEFVGTGTNADANQFRLMANGAACNVLVEAFES